MIGAQNHSLKKAPLSSCHQSMPTKAKHNTTLRFIVSEHTVPQTWKHISYENDGFLLHSSMVCKREAVFKSMAEVTLLCCFLDGMNQAELDFLCQNYKEKLRNYEDDIYRTKRGNTNHAYTRKRAHLLPNDITQGIQLRMDDRWCKWHQDSHNRFTTWPHIAICVKEETVYSFFLSVPLNMLSKFQHSWRLYNEFYLWPFGLFFMF